MMLPLNLNLQLNAKSALWANDSTLEMLHKHILKYDQLKYKKERKGKAGSGFSFFRRGRAPRTCCWRRRWALRTRTCDDLSTTTHPLQHRSFELDRQETSTAECEWILAQLLSSGKGSALRTCCWRRRWALYPTKLRSTHLSYAFTAIRLKKELESSTERVTLAQRYFIL